MFLLRLEHLSLLSPSAKQAHVTKLEAHEDEWCLS